MSKRIPEDIWDPDLDITRQMMDWRIKNCTHYFGWQHAIRIILERKIPFNALKIAEIGCGTGTMSLTLGLQGASITLLDFNQRVLEKAKDIFDLFNCEANFIHADCMEPPSADLVSKFDFVISGGLAEHFIGDDREVCIRYHRLLLKEGGFAFIGVPNKLSPVYQWIKEFKKLTGTWNLEIEVPFTKQELKNLAAKVGFKEAYVIGNASLKKDLVDYSLGFASAVKELFPSYVQKRLQARKEREKIRSDSTDDMLQYCQDMVTALRQGYFKRPRSPLVNTFSSGLILFAFN
jgi:2-polyprenyl-3-methyl-5-hydroxy-6-metoxy-1,4-benzoquinol methylase